MAHSAGEKQATISPSAFQSLDGSQCLGSQEGFELGKGLLDGIQIRAVGWQVVQSGTGGFDCLADPGGLVGTRTCST